VKSAVEVAGAVYQKEGFSHGKLFES
jgi:hypothetical protein